MNCKILTTAIVIAGFAGPEAFAAVGYGDYGGTYGGQRVVAETKQPDDKPSSETFYIGAMFDFNLATFSNKLTVLGTGNTATDDYSFARQLGFDLSAGWQFAPRWRVEVGYGNTGVFSDSDSGTEFDTSAQYFMLNGIYTFAKWTTTSAYVGAGAGAAILNTSWSGIYFMPDAKTSLNSTGFNGQLMLGVEEHLGSGLYLGLAYKSSYMTADHRHDLRLLDNDVFRSEIKGIWTNTIALGVRYAF